MLMISRKETYVYCLRNNVFDKILEYQEGARKTIESLVKLEAEGKGNTEEYLRAYEKYREYQAKVDVLLELDKMFISD